jgi:ABC-type lipoprotein export system ATPase subunit
VGLEERATIGPTRCRVGSRGDASRTTAINPTSVLADEPRGELDSQTRPDILSLSWQIVVLEEMALAVATPDPVLHDYASTIYEPSDGRLTQAGVEES